MIRRLSTASFWARTHVPSASTITAPTHFTPKSVILLATPQNLPVAIEHAISFYQMAQLQVVVAGVDSVVPNGVRGGISELWLDQHMGISGSVPLDAKDGRKPGANWKTIDAFLDIGIATNSIRLSLANTAFATNKLATLFYFQPPQLQKVSGDANMGETLLELRIDLPPLNPSLLTPKSADRWTALHDKDHHLSVTDCTGNLIKKINNAPAAKFLEQNDALMSLASKDTKVYVKLYQDGVVKKYEVIAGGGGWGAKADILAISPEANIRKGDAIEFFMLTPTDRYATASMGTAAVSPQIRFECIPEETNYNSPQFSHQELNDVFGCGCESGFTVDNINYRSAGESFSYTWTPRNSS